MTHDGRPKHLASCAWHLGHADVDLLCPPSPQHGQGRGCDSPGASVPIPAGQVVTSAGPGISALGPCRSPGQVPDFQLSSIVCGCCPPTHQPAILAQHGQLVGLVMGMREDGQVFQAPQHWMPVLQWQHGAVP